MSDGVGFDELVMRSQEADLKQEEERLKREKARTAAWLARAKAPGAMNVTQLLEKIEGTTPADQSKPAPVVVAPEKKEPTNGSFPPPPTTK